MTVLVALWTAGWLYLDLRGPAKNSVGEEKDNKRTHITYLAWFLPGFMLFCLLHSITARLIQQTNAFKHQYSISPNKINSTFERKTNSF